MQPVYPGKSGIYYVVELVHAGVDGAVSGKQAAVAPQGLMRSALAGTAAGAAFAAGTIMLNRRRSRHRLAATSLLGGAVGLGCGLAWASRGLTRSIARGAVRNINLLRDARWLERNPIDYA